MSKLSQFFGRFDRRAALRGFGAMVALPWLEAMSRYAPAAEAASAKDGPPLRLAFLYVPNGVNMEHWRPEGEGCDYKFRSTLEPLAELRSHFNIMSGLTQQKAFANGDGGGDHARALATFLTGCQAKKTNGADIRAGVSIDQLAAEQQSRFTRFASVEIGCEAGGLAGNCDSGYSCAYSNSIAWRNESSPILKEVDPKLLFDRLFAGGNSNETAEARARRDKDRKSVLDFVTEDARRLSYNLGQTDRRKLDEYLTSVRDLENRLMQVEKAPTLDGEAAKRPTGIPKEYSAHLRLMGDLLALAFQTDTTRVATYVFANEGSNRAYPEIQVGEGHHELSHHGKSEEKLAKLAKINTFHVEAFKHFLLRLKSIPEGSGTLLDNCAIVYGSGISDGDRHNHDDLPIVLAGGGAGTITTGRHVVYENGTPLTNLYLSLLERIGVHRESLGDSNAKLGQLTL
jgi:hypothetical protein